MEAELGRERSIAVVARLEKKQQMEAVKHDALIQFNKKMQQKVSLLQTLGQQSLLCIFPVLYFV